MFTTRHGKQWRSRTDFSPRTKTIAGAPHPAPAQSVGPAAVVIGRSSGARRRLRFFMTWTHRTSHEPVATHRRSMTGSTLSWDVDLFDGVDTGFEVDDVNPVRDYCPDQDAQGYG